jgi:hypothetical protein
MPEALEKDVQAAPSAHRAQVEALFDDRFLLFTRLVLACPAVKLKNQTERRLEGVTNIASDRLFQCQMTILLRIVMMIAEGPPGAAGSPRLPARRSRSISGVHDRHVWR